LTPPRSFAPGELRRDPLTGRWVAVAPARGERPIRVPPGHEIEGEEPGDPSFDPSCPFCPGNEDELPGVLWELPADTAPGWRCRSVPNRYPAFVPGEDETGRKGRGRGSREGDRRRRSEDRGGAGGNEVPSHAPLALTLPGEATGEPDSHAPGERIPAVGRQEVLIESPLHDRDPERMTPDELTDLLFCYRERLRAARSQAPHHHPVLFRNRGPGAGASLRHPHAQIISTAVEPPGLRVLRLRLQAHRRERGRCLLCEGPGTAPDGPALTVANGEAFVAFVPWAAERPYQVRIAPRRHVPGLEWAEDAELEDLARILQRVLDGIRGLASDPDYNYIVYGWPRSEPPDPALHGHLEIFPRTARTAGYELGAGMTINPSRPEDDAAALRSWIARESATRSGVENPGTNGG